MHFKIDIQSVYCDGGCIGSNPSDEGGKYAFCYLDSFSRRIAEVSGIVVPGDEEFDIPIDKPIGNNTMELIAMVKMLSSLPDNWAGKIYSDSKNTLMRLFEGWNMKVGVSEKLKQKVLYEKTRLHPICATRWTLLDGHPSPKELSTGVGKRGNPVSAHNKRCDELCNRIGTSYLLGQLAPRKAQWETRLNGHLIKEIDVYYSLHDEDAYIYTLLDKGVPIC